MSEPNLPTDDELIDLDPIDVDKIPESDDSKNRMGTEEAA